MTEPILIKAGSDKVLLGKLRERPAIDCYVVAAEKWNEKIEQIQTLTQQLEEVSRERDEFKGKQFEILGWVHAFFCTELDDGNDPRKLEVPILMEKAVKQLGLTK